VSAHHQYAQIAHHARHTGIIVVKNKRPRERRSCHDPDRESRMDKGLKVTVDWRKKLNSTRPM